MTTPKKPSHTESPRGLSEPLWEGREGYIAGTDGEGRPVVDFEGNPAGPRAALTTVPLEGEALEAAVTARQRVRVRFHDGDVRRPVIIGFSQEESQGDAVSRFSGGLGTRLELQEDAEGVTLRVGRASLTLTHDGKVLLKGTYVETCAEGLNRIKGGTVEIG